MFLLRTVHWEVLLGTQHGSSMALLQKYPFEALFLRG